MVAIPLIIVKMCIRDRDFITKNLKFVGRFGYDTYNANTIKRHKWPDQWLADVYTRQGEMWKSSEPASMGAQVSGVSLMEGIAMLE